MKSFNEWRMSEATVNDEAWGWEIVGSVDEVIQELIKNKSKYAGNMYCIASVEKDNRMNKFPAFSNTLIGQA